jgi:RNA:NAD 2'-phosphotransferase (TPT1/KptA family)
MEEIELLRPSDVSKALGLEKTADLLDINVERLTQQSLSDLRSKNPKKYELQILGVICMNQGISIDELLSYCKSRKEIAKSMKKTNAEFQENL